ncbi:Tim44/TimA family putative adaptor protein [Pontivivens ytuae]|uniref:Tim44 domain-containing protein n=1 Tax=Pontivivens ytuae TaxID=2789856 RepID=A0A7S9QEX3_9RHOB|nr:Tim44/TimA family putative adaptor protein [Pontivivens ytuae]QPH55897.1 Tim44 domain-containing protein [Pontivivens ytuae]
MIQLIVLAAVAVFLILRLRSVLGTRTGFEGPPKTSRVPGPENDRQDHPFEVIEGGGTDQDIADHVDPESDAGQAIANMKKVEPDFSLGEFLGGARQAYEMILMAYENGDLKTLEQFLAPDVFKGFEQAVESRAEAGLTVDARFVGVRELKLKDAKFDEMDNVADITIRFVGELTSVVKNATGEIVEGDPQEIKRQADVWTFSRVMGSENPNWLLVATGA